MLGALAFFLAMSRSAPAKTLLPLMVYTVFYVVTNAVGATVLAIPVVRLFWAFMFQGLDERWLDFGDSFGYWFMIWGPLYISTYAALRFSTKLRRPAYLFASFLRDR